MDTPNRLREFIGQERLKAALAVRIEKARAGSSPLPHLLLSSAPEMGKRTLATAIAGELGVEAIVSGEIAKLIDLTGILSQICPRQLVVLEDVDLLDARIRPLICEAVADFRCSINLGAGPSARTHSLPLPQFTFVGLTSRLSRVDQALRRWCLMYEFDPYTQDEIAAILIRLALGHGVEMSAEAANELALWCSGSPGNASVLLRRIERDCGRAAFDIKDVPSILAELGYDEQYPQSLRLQDALNAMDGREFEHWAASMFRRQGYTVHITDATGDHGIDLMLTKDGRTSAVQCKRWTDPVGEPVLRDFYGAMVSAGIASGIVMTTCEFTASAKLFAQGRPIRLMDLDELLLTGGKVI